MTDRYRHLLFTPAVRAAQAHEGSARAYPDAPWAAEAPPDRLGPEEARFIAGRDSFYMATTGATGWPYLQHRGGPPGFVRVLGDDRLAFADLRGNRQYISLGNIAGDDRTSLFFMDYADRTRLKLLGRLRAIPAAEAPEVVGALPDPRLRARAERVLVIAVEAFDWNCPQYIAPRYTAADLAPTIRAFEERVTALEAALAEARAAPPV